MANLQMRSSEHAAVSCLCWLTVESGYQDLVMITFQASLRSSIAPNSAGPPLLCLIRTPQGEDYWHVYHAALRSFMLRGVVRLMVKTAGVSFTLPHALTMSESLSA
eukprot:scaffold88111_cov19-Tisochrysis_lutea.AAC.1